MLTPELIAEIIALAAIVVPITQALKKWLRAEEYAAIIISAVVTLASLFAPGHSFLPKPVYFIHIGRTARPVPCLISSAATPWPWTAMVCWR